ncbi:unnamed protein product [Larinioides sclopetarius]|uniref:Uncharacterized protein n=1 Tax=Larinioides sclopetarius TaxID=280406 RepID=A0AAV2BG34_9ARAC
MCNATDRHVKWVEGCRKKHVFKFRNNIDISGRHIHGGKTSTITSEDQHILDIKIFPPMPLCVSLQNFMTIELIELRMSLNSFTKPACICIILSGY